MKSKVLVYIWEIGKWGLVIFLLYPFITTIKGPMNFARVVFGEMLLIIFIGKMFYDTIIWKFTRERRAAGQEFIAMAGMILAVGFILIIFLILFAITSLKYIDSHYSPII